MSNSTSKLTTYPGHGPVERTSALDAVAKRVVCCRAAPAAVCCVAVRIEGRWQYFAGAAGSLWPAAKDYVTPESPFDLASLTKPVVALAAAQSIASGSIDPNVRLGALLEEARGTASEQAGLEALLSHRAGLEPHRELYRDLIAARPVVRSARLREAASARHGSGLHDQEPTAVYSDLGYLLVGAALERHWNVPLDQLVDSLIAAPLGLTIASARLWHRQWPLAWRGVVPTENLPWRGGLLRGEVHDENAWALCGHGLAGHAGAFGTAPAVARLGTSVLDALAGRASALDPGAARFVTRRRPGSTLCAGFDRKNASGSSAGTLMSSDAFGHLGFTGTSLWCDPRSDIAAVLLTNRVCPTRRSERLRGLRPSLHDALFSWAQAQR